MINQGSMAGGIAAAMSPDRDRDVRIEASSLLVLHFARDVHARAQKITARATPGQLERAPRDGLAGAHRRSEAPLHELVHPRRLAQPHGNARQGVSRSRPDRVTVFSWTRGLHASFCTQAVRLSGARGRVHPLGQLPSRAGLGPVGIVLEKPLATLEHVIPVHSR